MTKPLVEVLSFEGCPHAEPALELVKRVIAESGIGATVRRVDVPDAEAAAAERFLGSPTIRVNGRDIDPGVGERDQYVLSCRIYRTESGLKGEPDEQWLREALSAAG
ncbi:MAG: hypothetical protein ACJ74R_00890 [Gaiellaceae bacterium]